MVVRGARALALAGLAAVCWLGPASAGDAPPAAVPPRAARRVRRPPKVDPRLAALMPFGTRGLEQPDDHPALGVARRGLRWLARRQRADGRWTASEKQDASPAFDVGVTGLVLSAFLGAGVGPDGSGPLSTAVARGLDFLTSQQGADGFVGRAAFPRYVFNHAFATIALVEAAGWTGRGDLIEAARKALDASQVARNPYFAWGYGVKAGDNHGGISTFMMTGFALAHRVDVAAGRLALPAPFDEQQRQELDGWRSWCQKMLDPETGRYGYQQRGSGPSRLEGTAEAFPPELSEALTAGTLWLQRLYGLPGSLPPRKDAKGGDAESREESDARAKATTGLRLVLRRPPRDAPSEGIDLVFWVYGARALSLYGGREGRAWLDGLASRLASLAMADPASGGVSWPVEDPWSGLGGPQYVAAMAVLALCAPFHLAEEVTPASLAALARRPDAPAEERVRALRALLLRGALDAPRVAIALLDDPDRSVARAAAPCLGEIRAPADAGAWREGLARAATSADAVVAAAAVSVLLRDPKAPAAPVVAALRHADVTVRRAAAEGLSNRPTPLQGTAEALAAALADPDPSVRLTAARGLAATGKEPARVVEAATPSLAAPEPALRAAAAAALGALGKAAPTARLQPLLADADPRVRLAAAAATWRAAGATPPVVAVLRALLDHEDPEVREGVVRSLPAPGDDAGAVAAIAGEALADPDEGVAVAAAETLETVAAEGRDAWHVLESARLDDRPAVAKAAERALAAVSAPARDSPQDPLPGTREALREALSTTEGRARVRRLARRAANVSGAWIVELTRDADPVVRRRAVDLLGDAAKAAAPHAPALVAAAQDADPGVRAAALRALPRVAPPSPDARAAAARSAKDPDPRVRSAALEILLASASASAEGWDGVRSAFSDGDAARADEAAAAVERWKRAPPDVWPLLFGAVSRTVPTAVHRAAWSAVLAALPSDAALFRAAAEALVRSPSLEGIHAIPTLLRRNPAWTREAAAAWAAAPAERRWPLKEALKAGPPSAVVAALAPHLAQEPLRGAAGEILAAPDVLTGNVRVLLVALAEVPDVEVGPAVAGALHRVEVRAEAWEALRGAVLDEHPALRRTGARVLVEFRRASPAPAPGTSDEGQVTATVRALDKALVGETDDAVRSDLVKARAAFE